MAQPIRFVLSPCGTSLLTNTAEPKERSLIYNNANCQSKRQIPEQDRKALDAIISKAELEIAQPDFDAAARSAELNGIIKLYGGLHNIKEQKPDVHWLLSTDTFLGETAAKLVASWLRAMGLQVYIHRQKDLQTTNLEAFQMSMSELVEWCESTIPGYRKNGYQIVFNLTGGFKGVQGFLQTLAMFYADESVYIFESSSELLRIPRLPVRMDFAGPILQNLVAFRRLSLGLAVDTVGAIPETLLFRMGGDVLLSEWGKLVWSQTKNEVYQTLCASPSPRLVYGPGFEPSLKNLDPDRIRQVNNRIDQLVRLLELGPHFNVHGLDLKQLQGNPKPPSTHECDAWHDQSAMRIYGHYQDTVYFLDVLDKALH